MYVFGTPFFFGWIDLKCDMCNMHMHTVSVGVCGFRCGKEASEERGCKGIVGVEMCNLCKMGVIGSWWKAAAACRRMFLMI